MSRASELFLKRMAAARERLLATRISDPALAYCVAGISRVEESLRRPLRVVVLGECNSGKTSVTDLLIGNGLLPTSVVANTHIPVLVTHAPAAAIFGIDAKGNRIRVDGNSDDPLTDRTFQALQISLPLERLRRFQILDTPSAGNPAAFVGDADIVLWCTVSTRAWTESERATWLGLPKRFGRNSLLVATHKDGLQTDDDVERVLNRLRGLTGGLFREAVLVSAESIDDQSVEFEQDSGAEALRSAIDRVASDIVDRRTQKAEKIVRRLARLAFHQFALDEVRLETVELLRSWEAHALALVDQLSEGKKTAPQTIEALLVAYADYAEKLRPGVVTGDSVPVLRSQALTVPMQWPNQSLPATRLVRTLVSDLTGLLRMLSGNSIFMDPTVKAEYQTARAILLTLADLDGAFDALGKMLGTPLVSPSPA
ncbi:hypothetical protein [Hyphomicrobium sp.]|uniref:hypothetical protein n=1 Tax=Hyphomicrobium sp. TaxID=82 RepID=UPI002E2FCD70|nr:hypothetical protein [Hyphomicrobium sp.]HEX2841829.1 hypothetical protein [Hyphomicrobium sp.]